MTDMRSQRKEKLQVYLFLIDLHMITKNVLTLRSDVDCIAELT